MEGLWEGVCRSLDHRAIYIYIHTTPLHLLYIEDDGGVGLGLFRSPIGKDVKEMRREVELRLVIEPKNTRESNSA